MPETNGHITLRHHFSSLGISVSMNEGYAGGVMDDGYLERETGESGSLSSIIRQYSWAIIKRKETCTPKRVKYASYQRALGLCVRVMARLSP